MSKIGEALHDFFRRVFSKRWSLIIFCVIIALVAVGFILLILRLTIWREDTTETIADDESELIAWAEEIEKTYNEYATLSDSQAMENYNSLVKSETDRVKLYDVYIYYAQDLIQRGFVSYAEAVLEKINPYKLLCYQEVKYYQSYVFLYKQAEDEDARLESLTKMLEKMDQCDEEGWYNQ